MGLNLRKIGKKLTDFGSRAYDQANVFDSGRSYKTRTPSAEASQRSVIQQAPTVARNAVRYSPLGVTGKVFSVAGSALPKAPTSNAFGRGVNTFVVDPFKETLPRVGKAMQGENVYHGSARQQAGQVLQDQVNLASLLPVGKAAQVVGRGGKLTVNAVKQGAKTGSKVGAGFGAAQGVSTSLQEELGPKDAAKTVLMSTGIGTVAGGGLGAAVPVAGGGVRLAVKGAKAAAPEFKPVYADNQPNPKPKVTLNNVPDPLESLKQEARKYKSAEEFIRNKTNAYHGSTNDKLTEIVPGVKNGLNEKRNLVYLTDSRDVASNYTKVRGSDGSGVGILKDSKTGRVYDVNVEGKVLDAYKQDELAKLTKAKGYDKLSGKEKNILRSPTGLSGEILEANPNIVKFLDDNGIGAVRSYIPNGNGYELVATNPNRVKTAQQLTDLYNQATQSQPPKSQQGAPIEKTPTKPKVTVKKTVETPPTAVKPSVTKSKSFNDYADELAQSQGIDTNYQAPEMFPFNKALNKVTGGKVQNLMQVNPIRQGAQKLEDTISESASKTNRGRGSKALNATRTAFAQAGVSDADRQANRVYRDSQTLASDLTKGEMRVGDELTAKLVDPQSSLDKVYRVIADKAILKRTHGDNARLTLDNLAPEERAIAERVIAAQKRTNEINYRIGKITKEQYEAEKDTGHYARIFNIDSKKGRSLGKKPIDTKPFEKRKDASEFSDDLLEHFIKDPIRGALARQEIALRSLASHEFMASLVKQKRLLENKPNKGFQQLVGRKYGKFDGMWADNTTRAQIKQNMEFESQWAKDHVGKLLDDYKASPLGKTQRLLKATKTVLNPGTNVQNVMSNIFFFNRGAGVGVIRNTVGIARAGKDLAKARNGNLTAELIQAKKLGVFGSDSGKAMVGDIGAEDLASIPGKKNPVMKGLGVAEDIYGGADNAAKLALWRNLQRKGLSPEKAAQQVQKFTQDYHNVGRIIGAMADAPVLGKPFARFIPELVRLTKNNLIYNPAGTIAGLAAVAYAGNALSEMAGETDEERTNREGQIGNTSLPGTREINKMLGGPDRDISLNFAVGDSAVNVARAVGLNFPNEPGIDSNRALLEQLLPFEVPTRKDAQGNEVFDGTKIVTHLGIRPVVEAVADRNFMGQSIQDPENKVRVEGSALGKTYQGDIPQSEQNKNIAMHLARGYLPLANEVDSVVSAVQGKPNSLGQERTVPQAALRVVGIKTEKNDQAARDKRASQKEFFEGKLGQVNKFLNDNPDLKETYLKIKSGTKDRATGRKVVALVTPEKWQVIAGEKSGRLFNQLKAEDEYQHKQDATYPVDPIFSNQLSKEQRNQLLQIRASYSGDNIEQEEILRATKPWYQNFEKAERDRSAKLSAYFDKLESQGKLKDTTNERVKAYNALYDKHSPKQTPLMTKYYQLRESNPDAAKQLFKTNPELSDQFANYKDQKLKYINEKRKIEGVPAIDRNTFNNVTFGYEDDERKVFNELKYGKGYGGFGYGSGKPSNYGTSNPMKYAVSLNAGGEPVKPRVSVKKSGSAKSKKAAKPAAPKVSIKKSLV